LEIFQSSGVVIYIPIRGIPEHNNKTLQGFHQGTPAVHATNTQPCSFAEGAYVLRPSLYDDTASQSSRFFIKKERRSNGQTKLRSFPCSHPCQKKTFLLARVFLRVTVQPVYNREKSLTRDAGSSEAE
jgi:hypothetical protein